MTNHDLVHESTSAPMAIGALFVGLAGLYLLAFSGNLHSIDEFALFGVADNLANGGTVAIDSLWWAQKSSAFPPGVQGADGHLYSKLAPGMSLAVFPLVWLAHKIGLGAVSTALTANILVTALTFSWLSQYLTGLGLTTRKAVTVAGLAGATTLAWPYARFLFAAPLFSLGLVLALRSGYRRQPGRTGLSLALCVLTRAEATLAVPWFVWYLWPRRGRRGRPLGQLLRFVLPLAVAGLILAGYNWVRFENPIRTGYGGELLFGFQPKALWTLLFGPGLGFFVYAPLLAIGLTGTGDSLRRWPRETILSLGLALSLWGFYGSWHAWDGGWGWGPRFLVPLVPLLCLPLAALLDKTRRWRGLIYLAALAGAVINAAGATVDFNDYFTSRDLVGTIDISRLADWPPLAHGQLFLSGQRDVVDLSVSWPGLVLLGLSGLGLWYAQRATDPSAGDRPSGYRRLTGHLSGQGTGLMYVVPLVLAASLLVAGRTEPSELPPSTSQDLAALAELINGSKASGDVWLFSFAPYVPVRETMAYLLNHRHNPRPLWAWISDAKRGLDPEDELTLIRQATANRQAAWLWQQPADGLPDLAATGPMGSLSQTAYVVRSQRFGETGQLSYFSLGSSSQASARRELLVVYGQGLSLTGIAANPSQAGTVQVALFWQPLPGLEALLAEGDIVASVRLQSDGGQRVAQTDRLLISQAYPVQSLAHLEPKGRQGLALQLPDELPAGLYHLKLRLYHGSSQMPLPADSGQLEIDLVSFSLED
jgi:hypothetical protein